MPEALLTSSMAASARTEMAIHVLTVQPFSWLTPTRRLENEVNHFPAGKLAKPGQSRERERQLGRHPATTEIVLPHNGVRKERIYEP